MVHLPTFATSSVVRLAALFSTSTQRHPDHVAAVSTTSTDPCAALMTHVYSGVHVNSVLGVEACFNSFPEIKAADKEAQISTLKKYFELYPYRLIAANSSAPSYTSNVDLFAQLDAIASDASVTTEFELHNAIKLQLNKLNDGHVTYAPQCFSNFVYMQPFNLLPVYTSNGEIAVVVDSWSISQTSRFWQPVFKGFWGSLLQPNMIAAQVTAINGDDPVDFLQSLADTQYGIAHAPETRFNYIFPSYAGINVTNSKFSFTDRFPESDSITYTLKISTGSAVNVSVPWAALLPNETAATGFSSASMYYKTFCTSASNNKKSSIDLDAFAAELQDNSGMSLAKRGSALVRSQLLDDGSSAFYLLSDGITGVFALTKFHPPVTDTMDEAQATKVAKTWIKNIAMGLQALEKAGAKKLIIELTGNGGGLAMMGFFLAQYMFPRSKIEPLQYTFPLTDVLRQTLSNPTRMSNGKTIAQTILAVNTLSGTVVTDYQLQVLTPGTTFLGQNFSNLFSLDYVGSKARGGPAFSDFGKLQYGWDASSAIIVSNGFCGSTCAQFTTFLRDQLQVPAVTFGGGNARTVKNGQRAGFDPTAFAAGFIEKFNVLYSLTHAAEYLKANQLQDASDFKYPVLPVCQMPFATAFSSRSKQPNVPIEWIIDASEYYLGDPSIAINNPFTIWGAILSNGWIKGVAPGVSGNVVTVEAPGEGNLSNCNADEKSAVVVFESCGIAYGPDNASHLKTGITQMQFEQCVCKASNKAVFDKMHQDCSGVDGHSEAITAAEEVERTCATLKTSHRLGFKKSKVRLASKVRLPPPVPAADAF